MVICKKCWFYIMCNFCFIHLQVMRQALPDLFDAQPDLLFHLVTMLNPSILRANGVPVYSVMQVSGSFVSWHPIHFDKTSIHGWVWYDVSIFQMVLLCHSYKFCYLFPLRLLGLFFDLKDRVPDLIFVSKMHQSHY